MVCKLCKERGQPWDGDAPKCAFNSERFDSNNWNCATAGLIRDICYEGQSLPHGVDYQYCDDQKYATVKVDHIVGLGGALALWVTWYKQRGATGAMWLLFENDYPRVPTEQECLLIAQAYSSNAKVTGEPRSGESSTEGAMSTAVLGATRPGKE